MHFSVVHFSFKEQLIYYDGNASIDISLYYDLAKNIYQEMNTIQYNILLNNNNTLENVTNMRKMAVETSETNLKQSCGETNKDNINRNKKMTKKIKKRERSGRKNKNKNEEIE